MAILLNPCVVCRAVIDRTVRTAHVVWLVLCFGSLANAGILFSSSWDTDTGSSLRAINDGTTWAGGYGTAPQQLPYVSKGGPDGHNFLNMVSAGGGGWGNPHYYNWFIGRNDGTIDVFKDPANLYVRFYFRMHQDWATSCLTYR